MGITWISNFKLHHYLRFDQLEISGFYRSRRQCVNAVSTYDQGLIDDQTALAEYSINIISSPESCRSCFVMICRKTQRRSARYKRFCTQKCSVEAFKFWHWQKMSILPDRLRFQICSRTALHARSRSPESVLGPLNTALCAVPNAFHRDAATAQYVTLRSLCFKNFAGALQPLGVHQVALFPCTLLQPRVIHAVQ